jgi:hypothetical protein
VVVREASAHLWVDNRFLRELQTNIRRRSGKHNTFGHKLFFNALWTQSVENVQRLPNGTLNFIWFREGKNP